MSEIKRPLKSYLQDFEEAQAKKTTKSGRYRTDEDEYLAVSTVSSGRRKSAKRERTARGESIGRPPNVTPPPELGDNLNA